MAAKWSGDIDDSATSRLRDFSSHAISFRNLLNGSRTVLYSDETQLRIEEQNLPLHFMLNHRCAGDIRSCFRTISYYHDWHTGQDCDAKCDGERKLFGSKSWASGRKWSNSLDGSYSLLRQASKDRRWLQATGAKCMATAAECDRTSQICQVNILGRTKSLLGRSW